MRKEVFFFLILLLPFVSAKATVELIVDITVNEDNTFDMLLLDNWSTAQPFVENSGIEQTERLYLDADIFHNIRVYDTKGDLEITPYEEGPARYYVYQPRYLRERIPQAVFVQSTGNPLVAINDHFTQLFYLSPRLGNILSGIKM